MGGRPIPVLRSARAALLCAVALVGVLALSPSYASAATSRPSEAPITGANIPGLSNPYALTVDSADDLWLSDIGSSKVTELSSTGAFLHENDGTGSWAGSGQLRGLAYGEAAGEIFVADSNFDDLWGLKASDATDSGTDLFGPPWDTGIHTGCCFLKDAVDNSSAATDGDLYVAARNNGTVSRVKATGLETFEAAPFSEAAPYISGDQLTGPFSAPTGVAVDSVGNLYVAASNGVFIYEPSGKLIDEFTEAGGVALTELVAIAVDPASGNILTATESSIFELSPSGALEAQISAANGAPFGVIQGLAVSNTGTLYASDGPSRAIDVFGPAVKLPPASDAGSAIEVSDGAATLQARINPNGHSTSYFFQYGTADCTLQPLGCIDVPASPIEVGSGLTPVTVTQRLGGLQPSTTYFYRVILEDTQTHEVLAAPVRTFTTQADGASLLPDLRQWQLVSPADKGTAQVYGGSETGIGESAAGGSAITYLANAPTQSDPAGASGEIQVLSSRSPSGWRSEDLATPHRAATGDSPGTSPEYRFFSEELTNAIVQPFGRFNPELSPDASELTPYLRNLAGCTGGCLGPLVTAANTPAGTRFGEERLCEENNGNVVQSVCGPIFEGASADGSHVVLRSAAPLTIGAPRGEHNGSSVIGSLYEWSGSQLQLISVLPGGSAAPVPNREEQPLLGSKLGLSESSARRVVSDDGSRIFWESGRNLYMRDTTAEETVQLDAAQSRCITCESGGGQFQIASTSGSRVFFTDSRRLTLDSGADPTSFPGKRDLYECRIVTSHGGQDACELTDRTPSESGESANVQGGVLGASADGNAIYFVADGTFGGLEGQRPGTCLNTGSAPGANCNLYVLRDGQGIQFIASLSGEDQRDWSDDTSFQPARVSPNGNWLTFLSDRPLTGYENRDAVTGKPDAEAFLYDSGSSNLHCASCNPTGARPIGIEYGELASGNSRVLPAVREERMLEGWVSALLPHTNSFGVHYPDYQPRYLSNSGRLYFNSLDALVPSDTNATGDVYQYEPPGVGSCTAVSSTYSSQDGGCVDLISSGTSPERSAFLDASESGNDVFFLTSSKLSPQDVDSAQDVYDAHSCEEPAGCLTEPAPPSPPCTGEACQAHVGVPVEARPQSQSFSGPGNPVTCRKGQVKKGGKCVKQKAKKKGKKSKKGGKKSGSGKKSQNYAKRRGTVNKHGRGR
jgi:hypothetical protein